jgi:hypothetical protein
LGNQTRAGEIPEGFMPRMLFARGWRGAIVKKVQQGLGQEGYYGRVSLEVDQ